MVKAKDAILSLRTETVERLLIELAKEKDRAWQRRDYPEHRRLKDVVRELRAEVDRRRTA